MSHPEPLPIVAIVGRPNVGKSRLFNRYAGHNRALVQNQPGITRDRIAEEITVSGRRILLVDTAGLDPEPDAQLSLESQVQAQARSAVDRADAILFVVDGQVGLLPEDEAIARILRRTESPLCLAVNKIDIPEHEDRVHEFHRLGFASTWGVSAEHGRGAFDALEDLVAALPEEPESDSFDAGADPGRILTLPSGDAVPDYSETPVDGDFGVDEAKPSLLRRDVEQDELRVAVVGRPNVGKSSLVNRLLGEERVVVSDIPGTTRDAIDTWLEVDGSAFVLVDTAGLRRPGRRDQRVERASALMTVRSLERADTALLLIDASEGFTDQDAHVASLVRDRGCAAVVLANKWDQVPAERGEEVVDAVKHGLRFMSDVPVLSISALTGARITRVFPALLKVAAAGRERIPTPELNRWLQETVRRHEPKLARKANQVRRPIKFFYAVQTGVRPPTFTFFCTQANSIQTSYRRYLENRLRERFGFDGTPIRLQMRNRAR